MKFKSTTVIITLAFVVFITSLLVYRISRIAVRETKYSQGLQQLEMARSAAAVIEYFLHHLSQDMKLLASFPGLQYFETEPLQSNIDYFYANSRNEGLKAIFLIDSNNPSRLLQRRSPSRVDSPAYCRKNQHL